DSQGNVMVEDPSVLLPGKATLLDLMIEDPNQRAEIRAQVTVQPGPCRLAVIPSMEIFDNATGKSTIFLVEDPNLQRAGMVGMVLGQQTARLNVVNVALRAEVNPGLCRVELRFLDADRNIVMAGSAAVLPGEAAFLDFTSGRDVFPV